MSTVSDAYWTARPKYGEAQHFFRELVESVPLCKDQKCEKNHFFDRYRGSPGDVDGNGRCEYEPVYAFSLPAYTVSSSRKEFLRIHSQIQKLHAYWKREAPFDRCEVVTSKNRNNVLAAHIWIAYASQNKAFPGLISSSVDRLTSMGKILRAYLQFENLDLEASKEWYLKTVTPGQNKNPYDSLDESGS